MATEDFLRRWSRLKRDAAAPATSEPGPPTPPASAGAENAPDLPPLESLGFESDFRAFMHAKVEQSVKRAALKKLFSDPRFNVMDGLDTYIDDYTKGDPISEEMLARLDHARQALFGPKPEEPQEKARGDEAQTAAAPSEAPQENGTPGQENGTPGQDA